MALTTDVCLNTIWCLIILQIREVIWIIYYHKQTPPPPPPQKKEKGLQVARISSFLLQTLMPKLIIMENLCKWLPFFWIPNFDHHSLIIGWVCPKNFLALNIFCGTSRQNNHIRYSSRNLANLTIYTQKKSKIINFHDSFTIYKSYKLRYAKRYSNVVDPLIVE